MKFFIMFFFVIDIIKLATVITFLNIPSTVTKMGGDLGLRELFHAVVAFLHSLCH